tara:strand:+ start:73083 stop:73382 length:300 start_codon:yes stop_codon:yes gene_type:complete
VVKIKWTSQSIEDLASIFEYIARDSHQIASIFVERLYFHTDQLIENPFSGRKVSEMKDKNVRELIYKNYRIVYRIINNDEIQILTVFNSFKLLDLRNFK